MRIRVLGALAASMVWASLAPAQNAPAPGKAATKGAAPAAKAAAPAAPGQATPGDVLATVNGAKITRGEVVALLSQFPITPGTEDQAYTGAINSLVGLKLLEQFLNKEKTEVNPKDVEEQVSKIEGQLKADGRDLATALAQNGMSTDELRRQITQSLKWRNYVLAKATDDELKKRFERDRDVYNQTQVKASHILIKVDPEAKQEDKDKAKQKLEGIKKEIESNAISFADAANKYSEDDGNIKTKAGGDLGFFFRKGQFIEEFAAAAFQQKLGTISDPVATDFGYHLIQVTDRKEGQPTRYEDAKPAITNEFAQELQQQIVEEQRKTAKVDIKPMPADLFGRPAPAPGAPATKGAAPATKGAAPATKGAAPATKGAAPAGKTANPPR